MICRTCGDRFAPLSIKDWEYVPIFYTKERPDYKGRVNGFYAKNKSAEKRRNELYNSDKLGECGCMR